MALTDFLQLLSNIFMVATIPVYIMYLITLFKNRKDETLKFPFFKLMFSLGIADVGMIFTLIMGNDLAASGLVPEVFVFLGGLSARLANSGLYGFGLAQNFGVLFVAFNRFSAYILPLKHNKIWTDKVARNFIIAQWLLPFILIIPLLFYFKFQIAVESDNKTVLLQWDTSVPFVQLYTYIVNGLLSGLISIMIIVIYTIIFLAALKRKIVSKQPMSKMEKTALKMATTGFIASVGLFISLFDTYVFLGSWYLFRLNFPSVATYYLISDVGNSIYAAVNPYAMFVFSRTVRHRFAELFCRAWHPYSEQQSGTTATVTLFRSSRVTPRHRQP